MWVEALEGMNEGLGTRSKALPGGEEEVTALANILRMRTERSKLSREVRIVLSEELGGVQMKESPKERTSCSESVSTFELRL